MLWLADIHGRLALFYKETEEEEWMEGSKTVNGRKELGRKS